MEFLIMPSNNLRMTASKMGYMKDTKYIIGDECEAALDDMLTNLQQEDKVSRSFRREIANSEVVEKDLFPILKATVNDVTTCHQVVKVLSNLTLPMAILIPVKHQMTPTDWEKRRGIQHMEGTIKSYFANAFITNILVEHMKNNIEDAGDYPMEKTYISMMLDIVALIRNVLHIDDIRPCSNNSEIIVANLLEAGFDDVIIDMLARDEGSVWVPTITQVLGLMFRSHKSDQLLQLLSHFDNSSNAEDTEDTSPADDKDDDTRPESPDADECEDAASPTGSENQDELSDKDSSGSRTPTNSMNDNESVSSPSSNYSDSTSTSTDAEIIIKELGTKLSQFAIKIAKRGLDRCILLCQTEILKGLEDVCFLWMQNYFLPFASQASVTYSDIRHTLSSAVVSNLTYLACHTWQEFQMSMSSNMNTKKGKSNAIFKKLYLIMAVLRQVLTQLTRYSVEGALSDDEKKCFHSVTQTLCMTTNLRLLYPMLIRRFQPKSETQQYLRELVRGNTELLKLFSGTCDKHMENGADIMLKHFKNFVDSDVVAAHCHLLSTYYQNSLAENEAVFTFMYHLAVDNTESAHLLYTIPVFTNFANIWGETEEVGTISQESYDLMDFIMYNYTQYAQENPGLCLRLNVGQGSDIDSTMRQHSKGLKRKHESTEDDQCASGSAKEAKTLVAIDKLLAEDKNVQGLYCVAESSCDDEVVLNEGVACCRSSGASSKSITEVDHGDTSETVVNHDMTVQDLLEELIALGYFTQIETLQTLLLEVCYVKLNCPKYYSVEPLVWQYCANHKSVPLFAFTLKDAALQSLPLFKSLLQKIGLHQAQDSSHIFPSVPAFWTPEMTFATAKRLGPVEKGMLKFDVSEDLELLPEHLHYAAAMQYTGINKSEPEDDAEPVPSLQLRKPAQGLNIPGGMWMGLIKKANSSHASSILK